MAEVAVTRVIEVDVKASKDAAAHIKQIAGGINNLEETAKKTNVGMMQFFGGIATAAKGLAGFFVADRFMGAVMALNSLNDESKILVERMKQVTSSSAGAQDAFLEITRVARDQGRELDGVAKLYEKTQRNAENLGITTRGVSLVTEGFAASLRLSGSSTQEANAAMIQFGQVLASGKFQGDEFRSMMENNSVFMFELAKAAGVTMKELRKMSSDGKLDAEFLREALFKLGTDGTNMLQRMLEKAEALPKTFAQAMSGVKASLVELLGALNTTANEAEGMFTRMAKAVSAGLSNAARLVREQTLIEGEIAKALGKESSRTSKTELDFDTERNIQLFKQQGHAEERITALQQERQRFIDAGLKAADPKIQQLDTNIKRFQGEVKGIELVLAEHARRLGGKAAPFLVEGWKAPKDEDKKGKKGPKLGSGLDKDEIFGFLDEINEERRKADYDLEGWGKRRIKLEEAILKESIDMGDKEVAGFIEHLRQVANAMDAKDLFEKHSKEAGERIEQMRKEFMDNGQKEIEDYYTRLNGMMRKGRREDPIAMLEHDMKEIDRLLNDPATSPEKFAQLIETKAALRLDAISKLMGGEKEVLKDTASEMKDVWGNAFDQMTNDLLTFSRSNKEIIGDFVTTLLREFARIEMKKAMAPLVEAGGDWLKSLISSFLPSAKGNAFGHGGVHLFAKGGVVDQPTGFNYSGGTGVMGEAGPEAIMPLRRGSDGKLGVGATPVTVNVINNSSGKARTEERTDGNGNREIIVMIEDAMENAIGGGRMDKVLGNSFGVSRKGK